MAIKIQFGEDGKPFAEFTSPADAAEFMRAFGTRESSTEIISSPPAPNRGEEGQEKRRAGRPSRVEIAARIVGFIEALSDSQKQLLGAICKHPNGVTTENLAAGLGFEQNSLSGKLTPIKRIAKRFNLAPDHFIKSGTEFSNGERRHVIKPTPWLLEHEAKLHEFEKRVNQQ